MAFILRRIVWFLIAVPWVLVNNSCKKTEEILPVSTASAGPAVVPTRGGVALTFDDYSIDNWYKYMNLFDSLHVKATFYISNYKLLTPAQKNKLKNIQKRGHEIAFHSTNHVNFIEYAKTEGSENLITEEVDKGVELMDNDGFYTSTFAYPFGKHNEVIDKLLLKKFRSIRALNGTQDYTRSLVPLKKNKLIYSLGIDESSKRSLTKIEGLLVTAQQTDHCAVFLAHKIEKENTTLQIPLWKLKEIIVNAKSLNLRFYTISEISR